MKYKYLLWDVDGTLLDFHAAQNVAIRALFTKYNLGKCSDEMLAEYSAINKRYWEALERGEMTKPEILIRRFNDFFDAQGIDTNLAVPFNNDYQQALGDTIVFIDDAYNLLSKLKQKYTIVFITNGTATAQKKKLHNSGLEAIADHIFISEMVGYEKPSIHFFEKVISDTGISNLQEALIIGDSLTSDIQGGINMGIDTCFYNPQKTIYQTDLMPTYEICNLNELITRKIL